MSFENDPDERLRAKLNAYLEAGAELKDALKRYAEQISISDAPTAKNVLAAAAEHIDCNGRLIHELVRACVPPTG